jgi:hypothetical protein
MTRRNLLWTGFGLFCFAALLGVTEVREWSSGAVAIQESDAAVAQGDLRQGIERARRAAEAAVPFSPYPGEGYERLTSIALGAERKGDVDTASFAWRAVRSAAIATRPAWAAHGRVAEADEGIVRLARSSIATSLGVHGGGETVIRDELAMDETPSPWFSLLVASAALAIVAGLASRIAVRSRDPWLKSR